MRSQFPAVEPRAAGVDLQCARLHQCDQIVELFHGDDVVFLGADDVPQWEDSLILAAMCF